MFRLNLSAWADQSSLPRRLDVPRLDRDLEELEQSREHGEIKWGLRQLVFRKGS
jgi:hypothetical protein